MLGVLSFWHGVIVNSVSFDFSHSLETAGFQYISRNCRLLVPIRLGFIAKKNIIESWSWTFGNLRSCKLIDKIGIDWALKRICTLGCPVALMAGKRPRRVPLRQCQERKTRQGIWLVFLFISLTSLRRCSTLAWLKVN